MKLKLIICSTVLFLIAVGFNALFNLNSFDKLYIESNVSKYRTIGDDLRRRIETGLQYGKTLQNYFGMDNLLNETKQTIVGKLGGDSHSFGTSEAILKPADITLSIAELDGTILYSDNPERIRTRLPQIAVPGRSKEKPKAKNSPQDYVKDRNTYITTIPIQDERHLPVGFISISFEEKQIKAFLENNYRESVKPILIISAIGLILLIGLLSIFTPSDQNFQPGSKKRISLIVFLVISTVQISTSALSAYGFKQHFLEVNEENSRIRIENLKRDVEILIKKGFQLNHLYKMDGVLEKIVGTSPVLKDITLYDRNKQPLYRATTKRATDFQRSKNAYMEWLEATKPITDPGFHFTGELIQKGTAIGSISINTSKEILYRKIADIGIDSLTIIVISILFLVELLILIFKYIDWQQQAGNRNLSMPQYGVIRPAAFLLLFGIDISISFLPLHMETLYVPILGLSKDTIIGLPISVEFLLAGIAILISGIWLDRRGWHEPFLGGLLLAGLGALYSWLAPDALHFIISRGVVGLGYGLAMMASQGFVITLTDGQNKARGLAHFFAGVYAGSICGGATGAMLAERIGYSPVFLIGAVILFSVIAYALLFLRKAMRRPAGLGQLQQSLPSLGSKRVLHFLSNRAVLSLIFFSSLPASIAVVGFLNYFSPIYLNRIGASQSTIGQILMLYGICLIYVGPFISRYIDTSNDKRSYVFFGCILGSGALLTFQFMDGLVAAISAVLLLGLSSSFVLASQAVYAITLRVTQELGEGKAIGIFRSTSRIGQVLGPVIFSSAILAANVDRGLAYLGAAYLAAAVLFFLFTRERFKPALSKGDA